MPRNFVERHLGVDSKQISEMLKSIGFSSLESFIQAVVPKSIQSKKLLDLPKGLSEDEALKKLKSIAAENQIYRNFIGMGYYNCIIPGVIQRNIFENPGWYTQYTPYQAEISQGRLEALINFQTLISDLTGLPVSNASLLDEATACAEGMTLCFW